MNNPAPHPSTWASALLGEVAVFIMGQAPPGSACNTTGEGTPFVKAGEFGRLFPVEREWTTQPLKFAQEGDVLICVVGATAGKLNLGLSAAIGRSVAAIRPSAVLHQRFLYYQLLPRVLELRSGSVGSAQGVISSRDLASIEVMVAPPAEQLRIVAAIEEHLTKLDAAVAALERAHANTVKLRTALTEAAVTGRSVASAGRRVVFDEVRVPRHWEVRKLVEIADLKGGLTKGPKRTASRGMSEVPYLRVANVQRGHIDLSEVKTINATPSEVELLALKSGDVLFNEGGDRDKLGRGWVWEGQLPVCLHQNHVFRGRIRGDVIAPRLLSWFSNSVGQSYFLNAGKQTTNLASISLSKLGELPVPIPPRDEQDALVAELDAQLSALDRVEDQISTELRRAARLRHAILMRAFEGKLVPQDPNDEPASALLDRIRTASTGSAAPRPSRTRSAAVRSRSIRR